jgi:hypothetical protein
MAPISRVARKKAPMPVIMILSPVVVALALMSLKCMNRNCIFAVIAWMAALQPFLVQAQGRECFECRAPSFFKTCDKPLDGRETFSVRVIALSMNRCPRVMAVEVLGTPPYHNLPSVIEVDIGDCTTYTGNIGETIQNSDFRVKSS